MLKSIAVSLMLYFSGEAALGNDGSKVSYLSGCIECVHELYSDLIDISDQVVAGEYTSDDLRLFLEGHYDNYECINYCLSESQVIYDECSSSYHFPRGALGSINRRVSSAVEFLSVLQDTRGKETFFSGSKRSRNMADRYKKHHYNGVFLKIEEAIDDLEELLNKIERCERQG